MAESLTSPEKNSPFSYFLRIKNLSWITRSNMMFRFKDQNVAEHSFFVTHIALWICDEENLTRPPEKQLSRERVMEKALFHDVAESLVGDLNFRIKRSYPEVGTAFQKAEDTIIEKELFNGLPVELQKKYVATLLSDGDLEEAKIVRYADMMEALLQSFIELKLGNRFYQEIWVNGSTLMMGRTTYPCVSQLLRSMHWETNS